MEGGKIRGVASDVVGVTIYKAVPFAAPPVGDNRWRAPQPVMPWSGVKDSSAWPNRCYQLAGANPPGTFYFNEYYWDAAKDPKDSEDCLYLNVWAPAKPASASLPVMVYYHGGGNRHGNNSEVEFNAAKLAAKGIIVVSAAYRLTDLLRLRSAVLIAGRTLSDDTVRGRHPFRSKHSLRGPRGDDASRWPRPARPALTG